MSNPGPASTQSIHPQGLLSNQAIRLIGSAQGVSLNATGDAPQTIVAFDISNYSVKNVVVTNANKDVSSGYIAVYTAPNGSSGSGSAVVSNAQLSSVTTSTYVKEMTVVTTAISAQTLYVNVGTAVSGGTVDIYVYGYDFSAYPATNPIGA
jgi:hypothetical protein